MSADLIGALIMVTAGAVGLVFGIYSDRRFKASKDPWSMWVFASALGVVIGGAAFIVGLWILSLVILAGGTIS